MKYSSTINIIHQMCETDDEQEWHFIVSQAVKYEKYSPASLPVSLAYFQNWKCIQFLLQGRFQKQFDVNAKFPNFTMLSRPIKFGKADILTDTLKVLLKHDLDLRPTDPTPLALEISMYQLPI